MRQCGLGIGQLRRGVCIAVERKDTAERECLPSQCVVEILARWIAVDFNGHTTLGGGLEHGLPVRDHAGTRSGDAAARVRQDSDRRMLKSGEHAIRLIVVLPQSGVRRRQHDVEGRRLIGGEIEVARRVDVGLDALQQSESASVSRVDAVNGQTLRRGFGHRHATGDLQSVRMVGDRRVLIASLNAGVGNLLDRRRTIAPFGVHLQITAVLFNGGAIEGGIRENPPHLRAAQKVPPKLPSSLDVGATLATFDGLFDGRRCAGLEDLAYHARRTRSDARNSRQGAVGSQQVGQGPVQRENRGGRPLVAEHLLLRRLRERQIAQDTRPRRRSRPRMLEAPAPPSHSPRLSPPRTVALRPARRSLRRSA